MLLCSRFFPAGLILFAIGLIVSSVAFAAVNPPPGKILFVDTAEQGKTYLALITPDGKDKVRLTPAYSNIVFPRICEKSGWVGFTNKLPDMTSEVFILSGDYKKVRKLLTGAALECFSPDGQFLLYSTCDMKAELYSYHIKNKRATKISQDLRVTAADWSPKGDWIAASVLTNDGTNDLYLISTMAQGIVRLTDTPKLNESFPVFTKDGRYLAFISDRHGSNEIEFFDLETREIQRPLLGGMYPTVSPDDRWVAYEVGRDLAISQTNGLQTSVLIQGRTPWWTKGR